MPRVISCPSCEKKLKVPDEKLGAAIKCPGCGKAFRTRKPPSADDEFDDLLDDGEALPPAASGGNRSGRARRRPGEGERPYSIEPFAKKWAIVVAAVCGLALLIAIGGFYSEIVALAAAIVCVVAIVVFVVVGRVWMAVDLGRKELWKGLVCFFVPIVGPVLGLVIGFKERGPELRGGIMFMSALVPALLGLGIIGVFQPMHSSGGQQAARASRAEERLDRLDQTVAADAPLETVVYSVTGNPAAYSTLESDVEGLLSGYGLYENGSASVDANAREVTLQCRGGRMVHLAIGMYVGGKTGLVFRPPVPGRPTGIAVP